MSVIGDKYVVRKTDGELLPPGSYFVIKSTDMFASAGLWAYVHCLQTVLELSDYRSLLTLPEQNYLSALADSVATLASAWQAQGIGHVPD